ncbi:MAG TPA: glycosyltransferase family 2 protein [Anaerolineales bacterium]
MNCSVVIPVYRGESTLDELVERLAAVLPKAAEQFEVVLVNDGSPDDSWGAISRLSAKYPWVRGVSLTRNYGQENATLCGILEARHEVICTMDDDLQHRPEDLPRLISKLEEGYDVVYGVPRVRRQGWWKNLATAAVKRVMSWSLGLSAVRDISAFKALRADLREGFRPVGPDVFVDALITWVTHRTASVEIEEARREHGQSNYDLGKLIRVALLVITNYTTIPLRLASVTGFLFTILGFFVFLYVVYVYFADGSVPGFPFVVSVVTIFSGVELFAVGIIGEYLARVFERSSGRPMFVVRERVGSNL